MVSPEAPSQTALQRLQSLRSLELLGAALIQEAINELDPNDPASLMDSETILDFASSGQTLHPGDESWGGVVERATTIYNRSSSAFHPSQQG